MKIALLYPNRENLFAISMELCKRLNSPDFHHRPQKEADSLRVARHTFEATPEPGELTQRRLLRVYPFSTSALAIWSQLRSEPS
jgi:hypothetical protein